MTWTVAFIVLGLTYGYFATAVPDLLAENQAVAGVLAQGVSSASLISAFVVTLLALTGMIAAVPGIQTMLKVRSEEHEDRVEPLLATPTSRFRYFGDNVLLALLAPTWYVLLVGAVMGYVVSRSDVGLTFGDVLPQAAATVPAVWTVVSVAVFVVGARPQVALAAWLGVVASFALTILGPMFHLWDWILGISPFWHVPDVGAPVVDWSGLGWVTLFTVGFVALGMVGFRRRDLASH